MQDKPILLWFRRDLRLSDHPALHAAAATGRPVIPVFIHDDLVDQLGAAPKWRLGLGVEHFAKTLTGQGSRLILRRGRALDVLRALVAETGAGDVWWTRAYDPEAIARDIEIRSALSSEGISARSFAGQVLFEPRTVATKTGGFYRVYSPFWRAVAGVDVGAALPAPKVIPAPTHWPESDRLASWNMASAMNRGAAVVANHVHVGEAGAHDRLHSFLGRAIDHYKARRDFPSENATSGLSENLAYGEISPRTIWHAARQAEALGAIGAAHFCKELVWREFSYHLMYHTPHILTRNWREAWDAFPWKGDNDAAEAWRRGRTGVPLVDAGMRELYVTGRMHNRVRMIAASYLTKHLLTDWRIGQRWFADCLIDWDPAANALGWQWVAGSGPDAAPFFRIFNPVSQAKRFDPAGTYVNTWLAEGRANSHPSALSYFDEIPRSWDMSRDDPPAKMPDLSTGRASALAAYSQMKNS